MQSEFIQELKNQTFTFLARFLSPRAYRISFLGNFPGSSDGKASACYAGDLGSIPGSGTTLVWKIPWMEEPGRLQFMGSQRVGHN